ncbi:MAG TPA: hypothetical protein VLX92_14965 [Kofleriaceae bacterium]|nr:hypothetical protein [Kofleriaceae bacterium]
MTRKPDPPDDDEPEKKERVIHTRVPESLEAELRRRAQDLGISVSNLVRNVLGHAFGLVGDVVADSHAIARAARGAPKREGLAEVVAWQDIVLAKNAVCTRCNAILAKATRAAIGVTNDGSPGPLVCRACMEAP